MATTNGLFVNRFPPLGLLVVTRRLAGFGLTARRDTSILRWVRNVESIFRLDEGFFAIRLD
jgi:hypothetical protein